MSSHNLYAILCMFVMKSECVMCLNLKDENWCIKWSKWRKYRWKQFLVRWFWNDTQNKKESVIFSGSQRFMYQYNRNKCCILFDFALGLCIFQRMFGAILQYLTVQKYLKLIVIFLKTFIGIDWIPTNPQFYWSVGSIVTCYF